MQNGDFVIVWESTGQDMVGTTGIFGQRFDATGKKVGGEYPINVYTTSYQERPFIAVFPNGAYVVAWNSYGQDGDVSGIFGRIFTDGPTFTTIQTTSVSASMTTTSTSSRTTTTPAATSSTTIVTVPKTDVSTINPERSSLLTMTPTNFQTSQSSASASLTTIGASNYSAATNMTTVVEPSTQGVSKTDSPESGITISQTSSLQAPLNIPLIGGLAGAVGALFYSMIVGVIYHLRHKSKNHARESEREIPMHSSSIHPIVMDNCRKVLNK
jgi:hypothetical protein